MPDDFGQAFNFVEGLFWLAVAAGFLVSLVAPRRRRMKLVAALVFAVFGVSDFVEMQTGSWGHPWWLALWKVSCVPLMFALLMLYTRSRRPRRARL